MGHSDYLKSQGMSRIPSDWRNVHLTEVVDFFHGKAHEQYIAEFGKYLLVNSKFISTNGMVLKRTDKNFLIAKRHDVLTVLSDLPNGRALAKTFLVEENDLYAVNQRICIWRAKANTWGPFIHYAMNRHKHFLSLDDGVSQTHILNRHISTCQLIIPPLEEQKAIAQVLSDFDNLIDGLERLIAKKRSIKEGVMQELLRPKEGWVVRKLDDVARLYNGYAFKSADYVAVGDYKIITIANVQEGHMTYTGTSRLETLPFDIQAHQKLELGDILVSMTGNVGRVCQVNIENALLNQRVGKIVGYGISSSFLFSMLNTKDFQNKMIELAQGGAQGNIGKWDILNFEFCAPSDLSEQNKIAQAIRDLDDELSSMEKKLLKYNQIKQGVMQELLTGKTRLV